MTRKVFRDTGQHGSENAFHKTTTSRLMGENKNSLSLWRTSSHCKSPACSGPEEIGTVRVEPAPPYWEDFIYQNVAGKTPLGKGASVSYGHRDSPRCRQVQHVP